jgi:hypothetical protein
MRWEAHTVLRLDHDDYKTSQSTDLETKLLIRHLTTPVQLHRFCEGLYTQSTHVFSILGLDIPFFDPFRQFFVHLHRQGVVFRMSL